MPPGDEQQLRKKYATELHALKKGLQDLKSAFFSRQTSRSKLGSAEGALRSFGFDIDVSSPADEDAFQELQQLVGSELLDPASTLPMSADALHKKILAGSQSGAYRRCMGQLRQPCLSRLLAYLTLEMQLLTISCLDLNGNRLLFITDLDRAGIAATFGLQDPLAFGAAGSAPADAGGSEVQLAKRLRPSGNSDDVTQLLQFQSRQERDRQEKGQVLLDLLDRKTARQQQELQKYQTGGAAVREHCPHLTKEACRRAHNSPFACGRVHQRKIIYDWTDESLGNCNFLGNCYNVSRCKRVHYELDSDEEGGEGGAGPGLLGAGGQEVPRYLQALREPQWICCDVRKFDLTLLGKFGVIMTDPPWEIRQDLPYGTMSDNELLSMQVAELQDNGVIFMWVTARALELGRELLTNWGYHRVDELIWVKTNQLQQIIRTGRTGHWLNHSKEHCLVGYKGSPNLNRFVDCDVVVSEMRETSRKPDEMYPLLERLSPGTRKLEIFARQHNVRPGWVSLGNQLDGTHITDPELLERYIARYGEPQPPQHQHHHHM